MQSMTGPNNIDRRNYFSFSPNTLDYMVPAMFFQTQNKNNISILEFKRLIGVSYRTAWRIKHKLMEVMFEREQSTILSARIEIDDAYLGGE
jgi:hypothetical protein